MPLKNQNNIYEWSTLNEKIKWSIIRSHERRGWSSRSTTQCTSASFQQRTLKYRKVWPLLPTVLITGFAPSACSSIKERSAQCVCRSLERGTVPKSGFTQLQKSPTFPRNILLRVASPYVRNDVTRRKTTARLLKPTTPCNKCILYPRLRPVSVSH